MRVIDRVASQLGLVVALAACGPSDQPCDVDSDCRAGASGVQPCIELRCDVVRRVCAERRADRDRDGYAPITCASVSVVGPEPVDCDDTRGSAHPDATELCNGVDDDCDGEIDEEPSATDACAPAAHARVACRAGSCEIESCDESFASCDGRTDTGCEVDTATDARHCGACDAACPAMAGGTACVGGTCSCPGTLPAVCGGACVDTASSTVHCGACDVMCRLDAGFACIDGTCACPDGRTDCGGACRDTRGDPASCGACGVVCDVGQTCESGVCIGTLVGITVGRRHACALRSNGRVVCWGANDFGQLGNGSLEPSTRPRLVGELEDAAQIAAAADHTCARTRSDEILCWGDGNGVVVPGRDIGPQTLPVRVEAALPSMPVDLDVGSESAATTDGSSVVRWGATSDDESVELVNVQLDLGYEFGCVLESRPGPVSCWGTNTLGQLGRGSLDPPMDALPSRVTGLGSVSTIAAGETAACAIVDGGRVRCWGNGRHTPTRVDEMSMGSLVELREIVSVATATSHACALRATGVVLCWGDNGLGQLGRNTRDGGTTWAEPVAELMSATAIDVGGSSACALVRASTPVCWGDNTDGQLGDGTTTTRARPVAVVDL